MGQDRKGCGNLRGRSLPSMGSHIDKAGGSGPWKHIEKKGPCYRAGLWQESAESQGDPFCSFFRPWLLMCWGIMGKNWMSSPRFWEWHPVVLGYMIPERVMEKGSFVTSKEEGTPALRVRQAISQERCLSRDARMMGKIAGCK